jgi:hypothetical protein
MSDDQLVEVPRKQLFERSPCELSIRERQPNIDRNAAWICNASTFVKSVEKGLTLCYRAILDEVGQDDRACFFVNEKDFIGALWTALAVAADAVPQLRELD